MSEKYIDPFFVPGDEYDAVEGGGLPSGQYVLHLPKGCFVGYSGEDQPEDWYAEAVTGRGQGWRSNWDLGRRLNK